MQRRALSSIFQSIDDETHRVIEFPMTINADSQTLSALTALCHRHSPPGPLSILAALRPPALSLSARSSLQLPLYTRCCRSLQVTSIQRSIALACLIKPKFGQDHPSIKRQLQSIQANTKQLSPVLDLTKGLNFIQTAKSKACFVCRG